MTVAGSGTSTIVGTENDNSPSFPAASDNAINNGETDNSDDNAKSEPNTVGDSDAVTSEIGSATDKSDGKKESGTAVIPIAVAAGAVVLAGAAMGVVLVKRKR